MSAGLVARCAEARAEFDPTPPPGSLHVCHVPFERLTGVGEVETLIARRLMHYERIALTGPIGCGKSSVSRYALRPGETRLAPIWINVATEDPDSIGTVRGFLEILVSQLAARAGRADRISDEQRRELLASGQPRQALGSVDTQIGGELGGSLWLLDGTVSREVTRTLEHGDAYTATEDLRQAARDAMNVIAGHDQVPVLVCDDADRLLRTTAGSDQGRTLFEGFFGDVVRDLAEHLECGLIVAAQDSYREQEGYGDMIAGLLEELPVPPVDRSEQVGQIISARVAFVDQRATVDDLVTPDGVERLLELHRAEHARSLRRTLTVLRAALSLAAGEGAERVERRHIDSAEV